MKSLAELKELKNKVQKEMKKRDQGTKAEIIVGMGTCGIAAGARNILKAVLAEIEKRDLDVRVTQTGCIGMCEKEPLIDVKLPGKEKITYGNLSEADVQKIISEHVVNGSVVTDLVIARHK
ncbi:(2Fe-2S) ferredoxin domain-containing protein [Halanaerobium congolense]|jgi:NADP-reducing hydrogenase subunit HndB|uniref:NADP-reducing hydrogenase subunit HndB n=1 Tax=Halanaerobium congolense TaxID=54121 RepID=A0A1G6Q0H5_9FIRM|nr:(2Fe-2S) ferredoxin domain-containing protein [Halanaerobium congolense]PXV60216.1 NADP-reducing hydrogenase subunit HndB [Halanaerobium congolense]TDS25451.1 NADP-reducing hydrogenase subunit HndB [Halanaerobium congolense]SDC85808.1 NADP-reducing hydrogenase subunit HndB [Halanaerobium congolense]